MDHVAAQKHRHELRRMAKRKLEYAKKRGKSGKANRTRPH